jgi:hypothetical protein
MGTWGAGVYQNDHALDLVGSQIDDLIEELTELFAKEELAFDDIEGPLIYVHLLAQLAAETDVDVSRTLAISWKARYLAAFTTTIEGDAAYIAERKKVIAKTFDRLIAKLEDEAPAAKKPVAKQAVKKPAAKKPAAKKPAAKKAVAKQPAKKKPSKRAPR